MNSIEKHMRWEEIFEPRWREHMEGLRQAGKFARLKRAIRRCTVVSTARFDRRFKDIWPWKIEPPK